MKDDGLNMSADCTTRFLSDPKLKWIDFTSEILVRDCWKTLLRNMFSNEMVILTGKAGRGKSIFLLFAIFEILLCAKNRTTPSDYPNDAVQRFPEYPVVVYVDRAGVKHRVTCDEVVIVESKAWPVGTHYCFSDNQDICDAQVGSLLTMAVTSGDVLVLREFTKRYNGSNTHLKVNMCMPSLEMREMQLLHKDIDPETLQFKFDVVGGNPRMIAASATACSRESPSYNIVANAVGWMFGSSYTEQGDKYELGQWAINMVVQALDMACVDGTSVASGVDSSLFKEYRVQFNPHQHIEQFSSVFLAFVAAKLQESFDRNMIQNLKRLFGSSGMGNGFEFTAHEMLVRGDEMHWCYMSGGTYVQLALGKRRIKLIRNVNDIKYLTAEHYGLPTICNFPIIDAALPSNIGLQMTISRSHEGSVARLPDMFRAFDVAENDFAIVFVVPDDGLNEFQFPSNLGTVKMYVTVPQDITLDAFKQLRLKRK